MTTENQTATVETGLNDYELVVVYKPDLAEDTLAAKTESISKTVIAGEGTVTAMNQWGKKRLAYPIKHFMEGIYLFAQLKMKPNTSREIEANLKLSEDIIRYLLIKV